MNNDPTPSAMGKYLPIMLTLPLAGLAELASLYSVQALLPKLAEVYAIPLNQVGLVLSAEIGCLALALIFSGSLSDRYGRKRVIACSLLAGGSLTMLCALAGSWSILVLLRALLGLTVSGITAAATVYINEEVSPAFAGIVTGYFIFGNSLGSMSGRVFASQLMDLVPVEVIFMIFGVILLGMALLVILFLPASKHFAPTPNLNFRRVMQGGIAHFKNRSIALTFIIGFMMFGAFTSVFNFLSFHLHQGPFNLPYAWIGLIPISFSLTFFSAPAAGRATLKYGAMNVLTLLLLLMATGIIIGILTDNIPFFIGGIVVFSVAFFTAHSVALAWVSQNAPLNKGQATAFYLLFYYFGGALMGYLNGFLFSRLGWTGMTAAILVMLATAIVTCRVLQRRVKQLPAPGESKVADDRESTAIN